MGLVSSNGLERYKTTLLGTWLQISTPKGAGYDPGMILLACPPRERFLEDRPVF
jgi:hypothetical protein